MLLFLSLKNIQGVVNKQRKYILDKSVMFSVVGEYLKKKREKAGLTQADVAEVLKYSTAQLVSNFERGRCLAPVDKLCKLAKMYEINGQDLYKLIMREQGKLLKKVMKL